MRRLTLIIPTPVELRSTPKIEEIYKLMICDFYSKVLVRNGEDVILPLLVSVCGEPVENLSIKYDVGNSFGELATAFIERIRSKCEKYSVDVTFVARDDLVENALKGIAPQPSMLDVRHCPDCGAIYGTKYGIRNCKLCRGMLVTTTRRTLVATANRSKVSERVQKIEFIPSSARATMIEAIAERPEKEISVLEGSNAYTSSVHGIHVAPWYSTLAMVAEAISEFGGETSDIIYVQGNEFNDFTFRALAYLPDQNVPNIIVSHSNIGDASRDEINQLNNLSATVDSGELRAALLTFPVNCDYTIMTKRLKSTIQTMQTFSRQCSRLKIDENLSSRASDHNSKERFDCFYKAVARWKFPRAFSIARDIIRDYTKITETEKLSIDDFFLIEFLQQLYFGN